ncbi:SIS domain-containing protein [Aerococcaceae bacterium DSM 109653]|uniref:SIS domain-containing protein n=1 Tax=Fundicoccus ignavus TaxID=2664442 RepID=A0A844BKN8_9LACT|nr:MurR/RpiR family transcriptional regulator [Fundicoccus ignavus]MRI81614.1 SIS domain-containing protein [Fundicoccus ignavus]
MRIIEIIEASFVKLSPKEQVIATYILQNSTKLKNINIQELARLTNASTSTITRFCQKIGCENFVEFKFLLYTSEEPQPVEAQNTIFKTVSSYYDLVLRRTVDLLDEQQIENLIVMIQSAKHIMVYGVGSSGLTAKEISMRFSRMGMKAQSETDSHQMIIGSAITDAEDLVIGISNSGETKEVVNALNNAAKNGAKTIAITGTRESRLHKVADETLIVHNSRFVNNEQFVNSQFPIYFLLDIITLLLLENTQYKQNMKLTTEEIIKNSRF